MNLLIGKFIKFCFVGLSGLIIDFLTTWSLKEKLNLHKYTANSCGFILASSSNYILNRVWTFQSTNPKFIEEYTSFLLISLTGLFINNTILYITHEKLHREFYLSKIIAIILTTFWNFLANNFYTFLE